MQCSRCGSEDAHDYGPDGQIYCSACVFYGLNRPCWKCRMYLPIPELQLWRGQWTCQYCIMDLQDEERASQKIHETRPAGEQHQDRDHESERCDRCRRKLTLVYIFNDRKLCENCIEKEKDEWKEQGGGAGATPTIMTFRVKGNEGLLSYLVEKLSNSLSDYFDLQRDKKSRTNHIIRGDSKRSGKPAMPLNKEEGTKDSDVVPVDKPKQDQAKEEERKGEFGKFFDSKKKGKKD